MGYREVGLLEIKEVFRLWLAGRGKKPIARLLGIDPKTVRKYVHAAESCDLGRECGPQALTDETVAADPAARLTGPMRREHGEACVFCSN